MTALKTDRRTGGNLLKRRLTTGAAERLDREQADPQSRRSGPVRLTKSFVERQPFTSEGQRKFYDCDLIGFGVQIGKRTKTYFAERSVRGDGGASNSTRVTIGRHDLVTADEARQRAMTLLAQMAQGIDPVAEREREHKARRAAEYQQITLRNLWDEFETDRRHRCKPSTLEGYRAYMESVFAGVKVKRRRTVYPDWMSRPAQSITDQEVFTLHRRMGEESGHAYANGAMRVLSTVMAFGVRQERLKANPVDRLRRDWFRVRPRKTRVETDKLGDWFRAVDALRYDRENAASRVGGDYLEFVLFTGLRREEAAGLRWDRVDLEKRTLTIADTKNSDPLVLPLSPHLVALLERRRTDGEGSPWVFPSPGRKGRGHLAEPRFAADQVAEKCGVKRSIHDLRRTFISVAMLVVPHGVLKTIVNHRAVKKGDVTLDYASLGVEDLRPYVEKIANHFLAHKAQGQGMRLAKAE